MEARLRKTEVIMKKIRRYKSNITRLQLILDKRQNIYRIQIIDTRRHKKQKIKDTVWKKAGSRCKIENIC